MSNLSAFPYITERSEGTPGLWNYPLSIISANIAALDSGLTSSSPSGNTFSFLTNIETSGGAHFQFLSVGSTPPSYVTTAAITVRVNSGTSDYLYLTDSSALRSSYVIGSRAGGLADGLNVWDASAGTLIVSFSKQSIRAYTPIIGQLYDTGGVVTNVKAFGAVGDGAADDTTLIQNALNATVGGGTVVFPTGVYRITSTLSAGARQILRGQGWASILSSSFSGPLISVNANTTDAAVGPAVMSGLADGFAIEDIALFSGSTQSSIGLSIVSYSPSPAKTVRILGIRNVRIQGFDVGADLIDTQGTAFYLTQFLGNRVGMLARDNSQLGLLGQCDFRANTYIGAWLSSTSSTINVIADRLYGWVFDRCHWELNTGMGLVFDGANYNLCLGCKFEQNNNSFSHFTDRLSGYRPDGNTFIACTWNGTDSTNTVLQVDMPVGVGNSFENNNFNVGASSGLSFGSNTAHNMLWNCSISGGGASFVTYITDRSSFSQNVYFLPSLGYVRLQGSAQSIDWQSPSLYTAGSALIPSIAFTSERSFGLYRSNTSTLKLSYGTLDISNITLGGTVSVNGAVKLQKGQAVYFDTATRIQNDPTSGDYLLFYGSNGLVGLIARPANRQLHFGSTDTWPQIGAHSSGNTLQIGALQTGPTVSGTAAMPAYCFTPEPGLGLYRSAVSALALSYGAFELPDGSSTTPSLGYSSNSSLGFYSSGLQTIAQSYGTFDLTAAIASMGSLRIKSGANNSCGTAVLGSNGSVNVANTYVKTGDLIFLTDQTAGGTLGDLEIGGIRNSSGFTILSTSVTDTSTVAWLIIRPG